MKPRAAFLMLSLTAFAQCTPPFVPAAQAQSPANLVAEGKKLSESGKRKEAIALFDKALIADPKNMDAYQYRGVTKFASDDFDGAIKDFDAVLKIKPDHHYIRYDRALARAKKGDTEGALADLGQVIQSDPKNKAARYDRGRLLVLTGEPKYMQQAIEDCDASIAMSYEVDKAFNNRCVANKTLGELKAAMNDATAATRVNPKNSNAWFNLAENAIQLGDYNEADRALGNYRTLNPKQPDLHFTFGKALQKRGLNYDAVRLLEHALKVDPNVANAWLYTGHAEQFEHKSASEQAYRNAVAANPKSLAAAAGLAASLREQGKFAEAGEQFAKAKALADAAGKKDILKEDIALNDAKKTEPTPLFSGSFDTMMYTKKGAKPATMNVEYLHPDIYGVNWKSKDGQDKAEGPGVRTFTSVMASAYEDNGNLEVVLYACPDQDIAILSTGTAADQKDKQESRWLKKLSTTNVPIPTTPMPEANFCGTYDVAGKAVNGKDYKGTLTIRKVGQAYNCKWSLDGGTKYEGPAVISGYHLAAAFKTSGKPSIILYSTNLSGDLRGVWANVGMSTPVIETATNRR